MSPKIRVLLVGEIAHAQKALDKLKQIAEVVKLESKNRQEFENDLKGKYSDISAMYTTFHGFQSTGKFDAEVASWVPSSLKFICHNGAGYDAIHVNEFTPKGIQVSHTPNPVSDATADTNMYLILGALRNFSLGAIELRKNNWWNNVPLAHDPKGKVLGILGMGGIGRALRDRAAPFGFSKIIYHNRTRLDPSLEGIAQYVSMDELLAESDVLSLNLPLNAHTRHIIDREALKKVKDNVVIVNTARGAVIDEAALVEALDSGKVASAGLDVFEEEPKIHPGLLKNDKVLLLPHLGTHTVETRRWMEETVIDNIISGLNDGKVIDLVPEQKGKF